MKAKYLFTSLAVATILTLSAVSTPTYAWMPKGKIIKKVQNVTSSSVLSDADTTTTAITAKPGDVLKYVIEVRNDGDQTNNDHNDMAQTVMTDDLPDGVVLNSKPFDRKITEHLGNLKPGQKVTKEYLVTVTAKTNTTITNTACFTGDSKASDNPQQGCNPAVVTVTVPETPVTPVTPQTPSQPAPQTPAELPHTGLGENILIGAAALGAVSYSAYRYLQSKRDLARTLIATR